MIRARRPGSSFPLLAGLVVIACLASWQAAAEPVLDSVPSLDVVKRKLELTPEQEAQLRPIFETRLAQLHDTQSKFQDAVSKSDKKAVLRDAKKDSQAFNSQVESHLTPSQKSEWRELRAQTREKVKERYERKRDSE